MIVKPAREAGDPSWVYRRVAQLHTENIDLGFLSTLGVSVLSHLYRAIDQAGGGSALLVATDGNRIVGFVAGSNGMGPIYRRMLARPFALGADLLPLFLGKPSVVRGVVDVLRHSLRREPEDAGLPAAELLSLAVDPQHRGSGIAEDLYRALSDWFGAQGHAEFRIVVGEALAPAHRFYRKMGARPVATLEVHPGQESVLYVQVTASTQEHS